MSRNEISDQSGAVQSKKQSIPQEKILPIIQKLISHALGVAFEQITPDLAFGDIPEWDSMGHMEIIAALEEQFEIQVSTETISELTSVPAICNYFINSALIAFSNLPLQDTTRHITENTSYPDSLQNRHQDGVEPPAHSDLVSAPPPGTQTIIIIPILRIPETLTGEVQSKLAYVDESILRAHVYPEKIELDIHIDPSTGTPADQQIKINKLQASLERKIQHVVQSMVKSDVVNQNNLHKNQVIEDHLERPVKYQDDPINWLVSHAEINQESMGIYSLGPTITRLIDFFERQFIDLARYFSARPYRFPTLIPARYLERVNYFRAFPHSLTFATHLREDLDVIEQFSQTARCEDHAHPSRRGNLASPPDSFAPIQALLSPAVCYHLYFSLADKPLPEGRLAATAVGNCFRYEAINLTSLERMWNFTMREIIFVGPQDYVLENREEARYRMAEFFHEIGLAYRVESANDPFFIGEFQKQAAFQSAFQLKYEIRARLPYKIVNGISGTLAVGSYNYHQDFFGRALNIHLDDGSAAHTGCVAFGLERIALAFMAQFGPEPEQWPEIVRHGISDS